MLIERLEVCAAHIESRELVRDKEKAKLETQESGDCTESEAEREFAKRPELEIMQTAASDQERTKERLSGNQESIFLHLVSVNSVMDEIFGWFWKEVANRGARTRDHVGVKMGRRIWEPGGVGSLQRGLLTS